MHVLSSSLTTNDFIFSGYNDYSGEFEAEDVEVLDEVVRTRASLSSAIGSLNESLSTASVGNDYLKNSPIKKRPEAEADAVRFATGHDAKNVSRIRGIRYVISL